MAAYHGLTRASRRGDGVVVHRRGVFPRCAGDPGAPTQRWRYAAARCDAGWRNRLIEVDEDIAHGRAIGDQGHV
jgi:hypothetical protein